MGVRVAPSSCPRLETAWEGASPAGPGRFPPHHPTVSGGLFLEPCLGPCEARTDLTAELQRAPPWDWLPGRYLTLWGVSTRNGGESVAPAGAPGWPWPLPGPGRCPRSPAPRPGPVGVRAGFSFTCQVCKPASVLGEPAPPGLLCSPHAAEDRVCRLALAVTFLF